MFYWLRTGGLSAWIIVVLAAVIAVLSIKRIRALYGKGIPLTPQTENGIHAILFWGIISCIVGLLGQCSGLFIAAKAVSRAAQQSGVKFSPAVFLEGVAITFTNTIVGLILLLVSAIVWFWLRSVYLSKLVEKK